MEFRSDHGKERVMLSKGSGLMLALVLFACSGLACQKKSSVFGGSSGTNGSMPPPGDVIPPTPVLGSFLTGVLLEYNGSPVVDATLSVENSSYQSKTNQAGEFSLPVTEIKSKSIPLKVVLQSKLVLSDLELPEELIRPVNQARADAGAPPLAGEETAQAAAKLPDGTAPITVFKRRLGLQIPENIGGVLSSTDITQITPTKQKIKVSSLPNVEAVAGKKPGMWTSVDNLSSATSARFEWKNPFPQTADVRLVFSKSQAEVSNWDGLIETTPVWPGAAAGVNVVSDFYGCTDLGFRSAASGPLDLSSVGQCGILKSGFPFTEGTDVYARFVAESSTEIRLSPVFRVSPLSSNTAPDIAAIPAQSVEVNKPILNLPFTLTDAESPLSCSSSVTIRSSNTTLLPNSGIVVGGSAPDCVLSIFPANNQSGSTEVIMTASDGLLTTTSKFLVNVNSSALTLTSLSGLRAILTGTCDGIGSYQAKSSIGSVRSVTCTSNNLSVEVHLPAGISQSVTVDAWSDVAGVPGPISSRTFTRSAFLCPVGYVGVPASGIDGLGNASAAKGNANWWLDVDKDFCVMKYPAKDNNAKAYATSTSSGLPWGMITRGANEATFGSAFKACKDAPGGTHRLISNTQWQTVARNVENVAANWSGGTVGSGFMARGHTDTSPSSKLDNSADDSDGYYGTGNSPTSGWEHRRTLFLSNGEVVWDFSGNIFQWVSDNFSELGLNPVVATSSEYSDLTNFPDLINRLIFAPNGNYTTAQYVGKLERSVPGSGDAVMRNGWYGWGSTAGVFTTVFNVDPTQTAGERGFRCAYLP
ncbi:MAG: hypothetical protein ACO3A4_05905 [Silvanigrellaceae bacterium]